jgi:hypothetical protein
MRFSKNVRAAMSLGIAGVFFGGAATALARQSSEQGLRRERRTTPIYATNKDGTPATHLTSADLEVLVGSRPIEGFTLTKGGSQNKLVFLIFDTASMNSNLLSKSKKIAEKTISQADGHVRYIVMAIDPFLGLRAIGGPSTDKGFVTRSLAKSVTAKQSDHFRSRAEAGTGIRDAYPEWADKTPSRMAKQQKDRDFQQDRQVAAAIITSLRTLNEILRRFPESDKIVHLHTAGIASGAATNRALMVFDGQGDVSSSENVEISTPDKVLFDQIKGAGQSLRTSGSLVFVVNPAGTRVGQDSSTSGEQSLQMLANESGGRYFEGADNDIIQALAITEQGYYQLTLPAPQEMPDAGIDIEIRPKDAAVSLASVPFLARSRRFAMMAPQERQSVILSVLTDGLVGDIDLKISRVPVDIQGSGDEAQLTARLPIELSQAEWDIYKVWRNPAKGEVSVEKEHVLSSGLLLTFGMTVRENTFQDAVLVHARSGTVLVCQGKDKPKG